MDFIIYIYVLKLLAWTNPFTSTMSLLLLLLYILLLMRKIYLNQFIKREFLSLFIIVNLVFVIFFFMFLKSSFQDFILVNNIDFIKTYVLTLILTYLSLLTIVFNHSKNPDSIIRRVLLFFVSSIVIVIVMDFIFLYDRYITFNHLGFINYLSERTLWLYTSRGMGFLPDPTAHATIMLILPALIFSAYKYKIIYKKAFYLSNFFGFLSIILSTSKIGIPLYIFELIIFYLFIDLKKIDLLKRFINIFIILIISISIFISFFLYIDDLFKLGMLDALQQLGKNSSTVSDRLYSYEIGAQIINDNLMSGIGFNKPDKIIGMSIHNTFIEMVAENGIIGLIFYFLFFILLPLFIYLNIKRRYIKLVFVVFVFVFIIKSSLVDVMHTPESFSLMFGLFYLYYLDINLKYIGVNFVYKK